MTLCEEVDCLTNSTVSDDDGPNAGTVCFEMFVHKTISDLLNEEKIENLFFEKA